ncbi:hypothetical protein NKG94_32375 [Micromonospora sp. M12]
MIAELVRHAVAEEAYVYRRHARYSPTATRSPSTRSPSMPTPREP